MKIKIKTELLSLLLLLLHELCKCAACSAADKTEHRRDTHMSVSVCAMVFHVFLFGSPSSVAALQ